MKEDGPRSVEDEQTLDRQRYSRCLEYVRAHAAGPIEGLYAEDSITRLIWREVAMLAAIPPAVVLQLLWPQVAEGVSHFSDFHRDMLARTRRTTFAMYALMFGEFDVANDVCRRILTIHERVRGTISERTSVRLAGQRYRANEPESLQWVNASLVHTAMAVYGAAVGPLERLERESYYQESKLGAAAMSILPDSMPPDLDAFERYFNGVVEEQLEIGDSARQVLQALFAPPHMRGVAHLCAGFLPERWRTAIGLPWDASAKREYEIALQLLRKFRYLPPVLRYAPAYHQTEVRMALARGNKLTPSQRFVFALDQKGWIPGGLAPPERVMRRS